MKPMFEEWMVKYGRRYESEEEKAMRYREFKRHFKNAEKANALGTGKPCFGLNNLSDSTKAESRSRCGCHEPLPAEVLFVLRCGDMYRRVVKRWSQRRGDQGGVE
uniref:Uncharacterized protein n=1 Tax=Avena sativa TaxID=4498 RepID=A0ACD5TBW5_AVESA